jgi:phosphoribosyl-AMP cyclohydrolase
MTLLTPCPREVSDIKETFSSCKKQKGWQKGEKEGERRKERRNKW